MWINLGEKVWIREGKRPKDEARSKSSLEEERGMQVNSGSRECSAV